MEAAAAAMDFHALTRRELQALCKRNGVRANMTNAAMADALQGLASVDGIDEIGTTLCLPTPGRSAMKSVAKMAELAGEEQHGSPLPRGRRVSVKSPKVIRMEVEEGEDEMKRDLVKEIVRTPGVALRSTSRRARATPAPLPTPVPASSARAATRRTAARKAEEVAPTPATLRRSQRTAGRKAAASVEEDRPAEDLSAARRPTRSARSKMSMALDQEEDLVAAASMQDDKVQQEEQKAVASDVKCDDPKEDEVTKLLGDNKDEEPEEGEEANSSDATALASDKSCDDTKMMEEEATKPQEGIVEEKEPNSVEKPAPLATLEDSPILGVLSKFEASEPVIGTAQGASMTSLDVDEGCDEWSAVMEMADEINCDVIADKEVPVGEEAIKEDDCTMTGETDHSPEHILPIAAEGETCEEDGLTEVKEGAADEMPQAGLEDEEDDLTELKEAAADEKPQAELAEDETDGLAELKELVASKMPQAGLTEDETCEEDDLAELKELVASKMPQAELTGDETCEEDDLTELKELVASKMPEAELTDDETCDEDDETCEEDEECASDDAEASEEWAAAAKVPQAGGETSEEDGEWASDDSESSEEEIDSTDDSDEEADESNNESDTADMVKMLQGTAIAEETNEDASTEDDDFSGDLPPEFDNAAIFGDSETESDIAAPVLEEQAALASATKTVVESRDESAITDEQEDEVPEEADATEKAVKEVDNIVRSLGEFTIKDGEAMEEKPKLPEVENYKSMSLRKLKSAYKEQIIASKAGKEKVTEEGKRLPLEEVDENTSVDC
ncbi:unnamed protein product [Urochloa humidicola]